MVREQRRSKRRRGFLKLGPGRLFASVVLFAMAMRGLALAVAPGQLVVDTDGYGWIATTLRATGVFGISDEVTSDPSSSATEVHPTAYRPPLYPLLLAALVTDNRLSPWAVGGLNWLAGVATVAMVYGMGRAWGLGNWSAMAALLTACDPILLNQSAQMMTESLAALLAAASLASLTWLDALNRSSNVSSFGPAKLRSYAVRGAWAGLIIGLACICRPTFLPWAGLVVASCVLIGEPVRVKAIQAGFLLAGIACAVMPWGIRNYCQFGHFIVTTSHGGYTLLLGNNPSFYRHLREASWGEVWRSEELARAWSRRGELRDAHDDLFALATADKNPLNPIVQRTEVEDDQLAYDLANRFIRADSNTFVRSCLTRISRLWHILPQQVTAKEHPARNMLRWAVAVWYGVLCAMTLVAVVALRVQLLRKPWVWGVLLCATFTAVHTLYWSDMRMRAPLMPFVCLLAAAGAARRNPRVVVSSEGDTRATASGSVNTNGLHQGGASHQPF